MKREEYFHYQDDGIEPGGEVAEVDTEERKRRAEQVQQVLGMEGYMPLHQLFVGTIMEADRRLRDPTLSIDQLRYEQGRLAAVQHVQNTFIEMTKVESKEEEYAEG